MEGKDLFIAAYDWRLTPGPVDGKFDGRLAGLTGASITDTTYEYGVDYLGFWLRQAAEAWQRDHPGKTLGSVDLITHSTGGLVARSYIQSDAYGDTFVSQGQTMRLPRINNLIMVSVPNRGASQPWQAMNNNFIIDPPSKYVIAKMLNIAYQKVQGGQTIAGFPAAITPASIRDGFGNFERDLFHQPVRAHLPLAVGDLQLLRRPRRHPDQPERRGDVSQLLAVGPERRPGYARPAPSG